MREEMASTAEANNRSRIIASAMVDEDLFIPKFINNNGDTLTNNDIEGFSKGKLVTLSTKLAVKSGLADKEINDFEGLSKVLPLLLKQCYIPFILFYFL